jgi:hypothetical protein
MIGNVKMIDGVCVNGIGVGITLGKGGRLAVVGVHDLATVSRGKSTRPE